MLEVAHSPGRPRSEWLREQRARGRTQTRGAYRTETPAQDGAELSPYLMARGETSLRSNDTSRSPSLQLSPLNFLHDCFPTYQPSNGHVDLSPLSYRYGLDVPLFSSSSDFQTHDTMAPNPLQMYGGDHTHSTVTSFDTIQQEDPERQWTTSRDDQSKSPLSHGIGSESHSDNVGATGSMIMPSPSTVSPAMSQVYDAVDSRFAASNFRHELNGLSLSPNPLLPFTTQTSSAACLSISPNSPLYPDSIPFRLSYATDSSGCDFEAMSIAGDGWPENSLRHQPLDQGYHFTGRGSSSLPQAYWNTLNTYDSSIPANADLTLFPQEHEGQSYSTDDVPQVLLKPEPYGFDLLPPSPGGKSDGSWTLISGTSSIAPSFGSPRSHRSSVAHAVSPSEHSLHEFDQQYAHPLKFENNSKIVKARIPRGRKRGLTAVEKKHARDVRDAKACWSCHISKTRCSPCSAGKPCEQCTRLIGKRRFCNFTCFNDPLESLHRFLVPDYLTGHFTRHDVESFISDNTSSWGTATLRIKLWWGHSTCLEADVVAFTLRNDSADMAYLPEIVQDENQHMTYLQRRSPALGILPSKIDEARDSYTRYIDDIVANGLEEYVRIAYHKQQSMLAESLLRAACQYHQSEALSDGQSDLLQRTIKMHITSVILERSLMLDEESHDDVQSHLQQEFPEYPVPKCAQKQIKLAMFEPQTRRIFEILKDWGSMMWATNTSISRDKDWAVSFTVFLLLVLAVDKTLGATYLYCEHNVNNRGKDARAERTQFATVAKHMQSELFERCKEIFHWKFKTRKGGKEACNPIRDGMSPFMVKSPSIDPNVENLVSELQSIVKQFEKEIRTPTMRRQGAESEFMNAGRLASIFLHDFVSR